MNILLILHERLDPNSGSAGSTLSLGKYYELFGHKVYYFSSENLPTKFNLLTKRVLFPVYVARHLYRFLKEKSIDVVDASPCDTWLWSMLWRGLSSNRPPLMVTRSHGLLHFEHVEYRADVKLGNVEVSWKYPFYHGTVHLWEERYTLRNTDMLYMLNSQEAEYAIESLQVEPSKVHVFPNGLPDNFIGLPFEPTPFAEDATIRIAQVGTFTQRKGVQYCVPAINRVLARHKNVHMSFVGSELNGHGVEGAVYSEMDESIRDQVHVIPYYKHESLPTILEGHYIKLFPTLSEGFGKALIEAMACGLAPITTPAPGPKDLVHDGHDALVIPMRDSQAIEDALERLISDRTHLDRLRHNAYKTAQNYTWESIAKRRLQAYEKALRSA
ncbi:MAG: glycosyltransferase family 1 protein [Chloroflexi bacterium AL-N5]|nr:glycosyltransferase family 1 protein [Chloroflexi bacterium AL-N5]